MKKLLLFLIAFFSLTACNLLPTPSTTPGEIGQNTSTPTPTPTPVASIVATPTITPTLTEPPTPTPYVEREDPLPAFLPSNQAPDASGEPEQPQPSPVVSTKPTNTPKKTASATKKPATPAPPKNTARPKTPTPDSDVIDEETEEEIPLDDIDLGLDKSDVQEDPDIIDIDA